MRSRVLGGSGFVRTAVANVGVEDYRKRARAGVSEHTYILVLPELSWLISTAQQQKRHGRIVQYWGVDAQRTMHCGVHIHSACLEFTAG